MNKNYNYKQENKKLEIIPKLERYIQYMLEVILKLPRVEKFSIGNEYKTSMYKTLSYVMYLNKIEESKCMQYANMIDAEINSQRIYLRIMYKNYWIDKKKFEVAISIMRAIAISTQRLIAIATNRAIRIAIMVLGAYSNISLDNSF